MTTNSLVSIPFTCIVSTYWRGLLLLEKQKIGAGWATRMDFLLLLFVVEGDSSRPSLEKDGGLLLRWDQYEYYRS